MLRTAITYSTLRPVATCDCGKENQSVTNPTPGNPQRMVRYIQNDCIFLRWGHDCIFLRIHASVDCNEIAVKTLCITNDLDKKAYRCLTLIIRTKSNN